MTKSEAKRGYIIYEVLRRVSKRHEFDPEFLKGHIKYLKNNGFEIRYKWKKETKHTRCDWRDYYKEVEVCYAEVIKL